MSSSRASPYVGRGIHGGLVESLARQIVEGRLGPGEQIDVNEVAKDAGVSRTVVREALKTLEAKGLLEARPRWGTRVRDRVNWNMFDPSVMGWLADAPIEADFLADLVVVRAAIEPAAARLAAARASADDLEVLLASFDGLARSALHDVDRVVDADVAFHIAIVESSHNRFFIQMAPLLSTALRGRDQLVMAEARRRTRSGLMIDHHQRVLDAIRNRDAPEAEEAMRALIRQGDTDARAVIAAQQGERTA